MREKWEWDNGISHTLSSVLEMINYPFIYRTLDALNMDTINGHFKIDNQLIQWHNGLLITKKEGLQQICYLSTINP